VIIEQKEYVNTFIKLDAQYCISPQKLLHTLMKQVIPL